MTTDILDTPLIDSDTEVVAEIIPYVENEDPNLRTHIINPPKNTHIWRPGMAAQDVVDIARTWGLYVVALCGHKWIPRHNPEKYDVCTICFDIAGQMMREDGE